MLRLKCDLKRLNVSKNEFFSPTKRACSLYGNNFIEVLRCSSLLLDRLNAKEVRDLSQFYDSDSVIDVTGHGKFDGISEIERFFAALAIGLEGTVYQQSVTLEQEGEDGVQLLSKVAVTGQNSARVELVQSWVETYSGWRIKSAKMKAQSAYIGREDSFMSFLEEFSKRMQDWLSGADLSEENWSGIENAFVVESQIILTNGQSLSGPKFVSLISSLRGSQAQLSIEISRLEMVLITESLCVVSYKESRKGYEPHLTDVGFTTAVVNKTSQGWIWYHVQQTTNRRM